MSRDRSNKSGVSYVRITLDTTGMTKAIEDLSRTLHRMHRRTGQRYYWHGIDERIYRNPTMKPLLHKGGKP